MKKIWLAGIVIAMGVLLRQGYAGELPTAGEVVKKVEAKWAGMTIRGGYKLEMIS